MQPFLLFRPLDLSCNEFHLFSLFLILFLETNIIVASINNHFRRTRVGTLYRLVEMLLFSSSLSSLRNRKSYRILGARKLHFISSPSIFAPQKIAENPSSYDYYAGYFSRLEVEYNITLFGWVARTTHINLLLH